ncbi:long-chain fatty acid--CoA ligase [Natronosporangium hydrolyticum]|uniref:Acyl-CoA synthetase n=1 Tax=Natronosporangium hydrolyticum TaxID=2811111 RepID=A0A895YE82_9ACTN|nr:long-chain fatty acid--CoA ligase [Natronosporangium hydrolyticum]QSB13709.1 long-chain fatty acid--CoA ligase [Natronosporangium hydrolyticum]
MTTKAAPQGADLVDRPAGVTTLATRVRDWAGSAPDRVAMRHKHLGIWQEVTWQSYWQTVQTVGHALLSLGIEPGDRVAIHSENRPEWLYADIATVSVRGATVGIYPTNPLAEVRYLLAHSGAKLLVAEDQEQLDKALAVVDDCPDLAYLVYLEPRGIRGRYQHPKLMSWDDLLARGRAHQAAHPDALLERMAGATPDDVATLIYTSGTTGPPKGVMLSIANVEFAIYTQASGAGFSDPPPNPDDLLLSYLPLCHVVERVFTTWFNAGLGTQANFAESIATVQTNLAEIQPTLLFSVPRIWEKILAGVQIRLANAVLPKRVLARMSLSVADWIGDTLVRTGGRHTLATRLVYAVGWVCWFRALRVRLGMRRVRGAVSGAAPIAPEVLKFFMGIGVPMYEAYGMTENAAMACSNRPGRVKLGTVGEPLSMVEVRIADDGEIQTRHGGVFAGYFGDPAATAEVLSPDGWLRTGDLGEWVDGTHVRITDRAKDIIITAGGKNIAPSEIENALKASPFLKEVVVIGDRRPYLSALVGIEYDTVAAWAQRRRLEFTTYRDLSEKPEVIELVQSAVDEVNQRFASVEQIKQFRMLPKELDHEDGELTATQKVRRSAIAERYADLVEELYSARSTR